MWIEEQKKLPIFGENLYDVLFQPIVLILFSSLSAFSVSPDVGDHPFLGHSEEVPSVFEYLSILQYSWCMKSVLYQLCVFLQSCPSLLTEDGGIFLCAIYGQAKQFSGILSWWSKFFLPSLF